MPELGAGLPDLPGLPWQSLSHRQVLAELAGRGWVPCGVGDWAVALRSPDGDLVARVCPFDPAYWAFVDLCRECAGNRWLPRIDAQYRKSTPWWGRCDPDDAHICRAGGRGPSRR